MNITLKQVEYFIALVRERNFGRAAAMINISQPALSVQINGQIRTQQQEFAQYNPQEILVVYL